MAATPPSRPVPHPSALARHERHRVAFLAADRHRQAAIEELAEALDIPAADVIPGAYVETDVHGRMIVRPVRRPPYVSPSGLVVPRK